MGFLKGDGRPDHRLFSSSALHVFRGLSLFGVADLANISAECSICDQVVLRSVEDYNSISAKDIPHHIQPEGLIPGLNTKCDQVVLRTVECSR